MYFKGINFSRINCFQSSKSRRTRSIKAKYCTHTSISCSIITIPTRISPSLSYFINRTTITMPITTCTTLLGASKSGAIRTS